MELTERRVSVETVTNLKLQENAEGIFRTEFQEWLAKISIPPHPASEEKRNERLSMNRKSAPRPPPPPPRPTSVPAQPSSRNSVENPLRPFSRRENRVDVNNTNTTTIDYGDFYETTGCQVFYVETKSESTADTGSRKLERTFSVDFVHDANRVVFVLDWTKLWSRLVAHDYHMKTDAFALEMPFLHTCSQIFLSGKLLQFSIAITFYNGCAYLIGSLLYPASSNKINFWVSLALIFTLIWGVTIIHGNKWFANNSSSSQKDNNDFSKKDNSDGVVPDDYVLSFLDNVQTTQKSSISTGPSLEISRGATILRQGSLLSKFIASFQDAIAIDLLGLISSKKSKEKSDTVKQKKSGELAVISFYQLVSISTQYLRSMKMGKFKFTPRKYTNAFLLIFLAIIIIFACYLCISVDVELASCHKDNYWSFRSKKERCNYLNFMAVLSLAQLIPFVSYVISFSQFLTIFGILLYGADVANGLTIYWLLRFRPLRRIIFAEENKNNKNKDDDNGEKENEMKFWIQRDAYERYLFIASYFQKCSELWGWFIATSLLICVLLSAYGYFVVLTTYIQSNQLETSGIVLCAFSVFIFGYIVVALAYANSAIDSILVGFQYCGIDDYQLLGGKERWSTYVANTKIYWYLLGFPITRAWIVTFFGGGISATVGAWLVTWFSKELGVGDNR